MIHTETLWMRGSTLFRHDRCLNSNSVTESTRFYILESIRSIEDSEAHFSSIVLEPLSAGDGSL
jgi:hypothetical protein